MVLNYIWIAFFLLAFVFAVGETVFNGNIDIWATIMTSSFDSAKTAFELSLGLTGVLSLWMGIMKIGENGGVIPFFGRLVSPLFSRLFPGIPRNHPAMGAVFMNVSANMLGLDNAATPLGLKAMQHMQELNPKKDTATDAMLMFLILNASGLVLIPIGIMTYRASCGAANPTDVFVPILIATFIATLVGIIALCIKQRINMLDKVILAWLGGISLFVAGIVWYFSTLTAEEMQRQSSFIANLILFSVIIGFILAGCRKKINLYESFIEGAKDGFKTAVMIIPYLVAILVAIGMFRASGAMDVITGAVTSFVHWLVAYGLDEAAERYGQPRHDGRCHQYLRSRLVRGSCGWMYSGKYRYHFLYPCRLFRQCGRAQYALCRSVCPSCRCGGFDNRNSSCLLLLRIEWGSGSKYARRSEKDAFFCFHFSSKIANFVVVSY